MNFLTSKEDAFSGKWHINTSPSSKLEIISNTYKRYALEEAHKSNDPKTKVGAILVKESPRFEGPAGIISTGYNIIHSSEDSILSSKKKHDYVIHAEMMALSNMLNNRITTDDTLALFVTHSPCNNCLNVLYNVKQIKFIFFYQELKLNEEIYQQFADRFIFCKL